MELSISRTSTSKKFDISEKGQTKDGTVKFLDRRLFMQLLAFGNATDTNMVIEFMESKGIAGVVYEDINDPNGIALLTFNEDPGFFVSTKRRILKEPPFIALELRPDYTMLGRTYSLGHETDLESALITRPIERATDPENKWAIWYPVRRSGEFEQLSSNEQRKILMEHGGVGRAYGEAGLAFDIRLACHGLNKNDNDFIVGLVGPELYPLSKIVQRMRQTRQTSQYLNNLGPFFVGRAVWQKKNPHK